MNENWPKCTDMMIRWCYWL